MSSTKLPLLREPLHPWACNFVHLYCACAFSPILGICNGMLSLKIQQATFDFTWLCCRGISWYIGTVYFGIFGAFRRRILLLCNEWTGGLGTQDAQTMVRPAFQRAMDAGCKSSLRCSRLVDSRLMGHHFICCGIILSVLHQRSRTKQQRNFVFLVG